MNTSWKLGRFFDIDVFVHWTFLLLPAWILVSALAAGSGATGAIISVAFVLAVFGCVLLHEFGHALMARRYGIATRDIIMLPIGGLARLERMPERPSQELAVALAGPAVNAAIALALFAGLTVSGGMPALGEVSFLGNSLLVNLMWANVALLVFNLLPAFPMDGGRVLRAVLAMGMSYERATRIAAGIGQAVAVALAVIGLFGNGMLVLVALFVFLAAGAENQAVRRRSVFTPTAEAGFARPISSHSYPTEPYPTEPHPTEPYPIGANVRVLSADGTLTEAMAVLHGSDQQVFPIQRGAYLVGVLTRQQLIAAIRSALQRRERVV